MDLGLHCLSRPFWQAKSVRNIRTIIKLQLLADVISTKLLCAGFMNKLGIRNGKLLNYNRAQYASNKSAHTASLADPEGMTGGPDPLWKITISYRFP